MGLSSDYEIPDGAKDMWKKFGTNTEAGKLLRSIYGNKLPTNINYPLPRQRRMTSFSEEQKTRWNGTTSVEEKPKPQPKGYVNVPKVGRGQPYVGPPRVYNLPFRKSLATIQRETKGFKTEKAPLMRPVRDRADMRDKLQDTFTYGGGNALPKGAMGNTIGMDPKQASKVPTRPRRPSTEIDPETGLDEEKHDMIQEFADKITNFNAELDVLTTMQPTAKRSDVHNFRRQEKWIANRQIELRHEVNKNMTSIEEVLAMAKNTDDLGSDDDH